MCLAVPGRLAAIRGDDAFVRTGKVDFSGVVKEVSLALLPEAGVGDYVLVHAGFAIAVLDETEAVRSIEYLEALSEIGEPSEPRS